MTILLYLLIFLLVGAIAYAYKLGLEAAKLFTFQTLQTQREIVNSVNDLLEVVQILHQRTSPLHEPQFTCYYCNNHFPKSKQIQIGSYLYCEEHADRGHRTRFNIS